MASEAGSGVDDVVILSPLIVNTLAGVPPGAPLLIRYVAFVGPPLLSQKTSVLFVLVPFFNVM
jgi:hypothetical protein